MLIKINNQYFTPDELGLETVTYDGKKYIDVTPFWIDCGQTQRIHEIAYGDRPLEGRYKS